MAYLELNGPSKPFKISLTGNVVKEIKADQAGSAFVGRRVITLQPIGSVGDYIYVYFGDSSGSGTPIIPNATEVRDKGIIVYNRQPMSFEASDSQPVYIIENTGATIDVRGAERG